MGPLQKSFLFTFRPLSSRQLQREYPLRFWRPLANDGRALSYDHTALRDGQVDQEMALADRARPESGVAIPRTWELAELQQLREGLRESRQSLGLKVSEPALEILLLLSLLGEQHTIRKAVVLHEQPEADYFHQSAILHAVFTEAERMRRLSAALEALQPEAFEVSRAAVLERLPVGSIRNSQSVILDELIRMATRVSTKSAGLEDKAPGGQHPSRNGFLQLLAPLSEQIKRLAERLLSSLTGLRIEEEGVIEERHLAAVRDATEAILLDLIRQADRGLKDALVMRLMEDARVEVARKEAAWVERLLSAIPGGFEGMTLTEAVGSAAVEVKDAILNEAIQSDLSPESRSLIVDTLIDWADALTGRNRPAIVMDDALRAHWEDTEFNEIWEAYRDGLDKLKLPGRDYDYSQGLSRNVVDQNGIPYDPYGPVNKPDVEIYGSGLITTHPIPQYHDVGLDEIVVDTYVLTDIMLFIHHWKKREAARYGGMTAQQAIYDMLNKLWAYIDGLNTNTRYPEYLRAFRHARWYSEAVLNRHTIYVIRRTYESWQSQEFRLDVGAPNKMENVIIVGNLFASTTPDSKLEIYVPNYVDGSLIFNARILPGATLTVLVDGKEGAALTEGKWTDVTIPVPMGEHAISFIGSGNVEYSFIRLTGHRFLSYTVLGGSQSTINGHGALTLLLQALLKYYRDHHTDKVKGGREHWINTEYQSQ